jgi:hypothetical protein
MPDRAAPRPLPVGRRHTDTGAVLHETDAALRGLLGQGLPAGTTLRFEAPEPSWGAEGPVLGLLLHRIEEDPAGRVGSATEHRDPSGRLLGRRAPSRRYRTHYLLTGWGPDVTVGHQVLGAALCALSGHETVPPAHLTGSLSRGGRPVTLTVAPPVTDEPLWRALGLRPRAALEVRLTVTLVADLDTDLTPAPERVDLGVAGRLPAPVVAAEPKRPAKRITERT